MYNHLKLGGGGNSKLNLNPQFVICSYFFLLSVFKVSAMVSQLVFAVLGKV